MEIFTWFELINPTSTRPRPVESNLLSWDVTTYKFTKLKTLIYSLSLYSLLNLRLILLLLNNCYPSWFMILKAFRKVINSNYSILQCIVIQDSHRLFTQMKKDKKTNQHNIMRQIQILKGGGWIFLFSFMLCVAYLQLWNTSLYYFESTNKFFAFSVS